MCACGVCLCLLCVEVEAVDGVVWCLSLCFECIRVDKSVYDTAHRGQQIDPSL